MALSRIHLRDIAAYWSKIAKFLYRTPPVLSAPVGGARHRRTGARERF